MPRYSYPVEAVWGVSIRVGSRFPRMTSSNRRSNMSVCVRTRSRTAPTAPAASSGPSGRSSNSQSIDHSPPRLPVSEKK